MQIMTVRWPRTAPTPTSPSCRPPPRWVPPLHSAPLPLRQAVLARLAELPELFVAVITGRCIPDIRAKVGIKNVTYAGNHGLDIVHPDGTKVE